MTAEQELLRCLTPTGSDVGTTIGAFSVSVPLFVLKNDEKRYWSTMEEELLPTKWN